MSRGFGSMQRVILGALDLTPPLRIPWEPHGERDVPAEAAGHLVDVYCVRTLQRAAAWMRGEWCDGWRHIGRRYGPQRMREAPPRALAGEPGCR